MSAKTRHNYVEEVEWLTGCGDSAERIALRLSRKPGTIARALYREGRPDLAAPFNALDWHSRDVDKTKLCEPCKLNIHQAHRKYRHDTHLCKCGFCKTVTDSACRKRTE